MTDNERAEWLRTQAQSGIQNGPVAWGGGGGTGYFKISYTTGICGGGGSSGPQGKFNPRAKLKPLSARLLAISNAISCRVDSLRRIRREI